MPALDRALSLFGLRRKQTDGDSPPIVNDGRGNRPSITVRYAATFGQATWTERTYEYMARAGYQHNSDVYACVSLIATAGKQVKWDTSAGSQSKASIALLAKSGGPSFIEAWLSYILLSGNDYIEIGRNAAGTPIQLYLLQPDRVTAKTNVNTADAIYTRQPRVEAWKVRDARGMPYPVLPPDMLQSKLFNPLDAIYGMAPLEAAMLRVDAQNEGATLLKRLLQSGFAPGWIEAAEQSEWGDTQVAALRERVKSSREAGETLFLQNAKWHDIGFPPVDSGISEHQVLSKRDIASVFHVPSQLIGDTQSQTYSNYREARLGLYMEAVVPLLSQFRDDWNAAIGRDLNSPLAFDKDSFDAIAAARSEATDRVQKLFASGLITQNEARRDLEYDPVEGGDAFYAPANLLPLAEGGEPAVPQPAKLKMIEGGKGTG